MNEIQVRKSAAYAGCAMCGEFDRDAVWMNENMPVCGGCIDHAISILQTHVTRRLPNRIGQPHEYYAKRARMVSEWGPLEDAASRVSLALGYLPEKSDRPYFEIEVKHQSWEYPTGVFLILRNCDKPVKLLARLRRGGLERDPEPKQDTGEATITWRFGIPGKEKDLHVVWHNGEAPKKDVCRYVVTGYQLQPVRELICPGDPRYNAQDAEKPAIAPPEVSP